MHAASGHVQDVNQRIQSLMSSLRGEVSTVGSHFHGSAASTFTQLMARFDDDAAKLNQALMGISEQLEASGKGYQSTDESASQALRGAGSGLNA